MSMTKNGRSVLLAWKANAAFIILSQILYSCAASGQTQPFTLEQALSAPFTTHLAAAPGKNRFAWVANIVGRRNIWVASPSPSGSSYNSRQITHYADDDGQEIDVPQWTPDADNLIYVRGDAVQGDTHPVPNPAWFPKGAQQEIWEISADGGQPKLLAEGHEPAVSPDGKLLAYILRGQVWMLTLDNTAASRRQLLQTRGTATGLSWSPDGSRIAFTSSRSDHSFIAVYTIATNAITYLDPSTDYDRSPTWSPDSSQIVFLRVLPDRDSLFFGPERTALPWSIRIADVTTGNGHEIWHAAEGAGSAYRVTGTPQQLFWTAGNRIVFPWERDGWLHLYTVPVAGGAATLLTKGNFEIEHVSLSNDRKLLVFDSNQHDFDPFDFDRRHIWHTVFSADGINTTIKAVTSGDGIETWPVIASDDSTIAVLRSDTHLPIRAAVISSGKLVDLAPQAIPADFPSAKFVTPQQVILTSADGLEIHGQLFLPAGIKPGERRPAMVFFHGGSQRQMLLGWHYMEYYSNAYAMNQYLVGLGYIVLSVNYRSGIGYGLNFREALNYGATGGSEYNDVMGAGLYLKNRSDVDGKRIGAWGGSYGGYLTAMALSRSSDLFAAGVDMHGVHDWNFEIPTFAPTYDPRTHPDQARIAYESSRISSVSTWRSPVLLIHGDDDRNVPFAQTEELVDALRRQKVYFEELIFPDEIHDFLLHRDWLRAYSASVNFLDRKLVHKPDTPNPPTP